MSKANLCMMKVTDIEGKILCVDIQRPDFGRRWGGGGGKSGHGL